MKVLIIPDVHEDLGKLGKALSKVTDNIQRIVFLGDWFDTFAGFNADRLAVVCKVINDGITNGVSIAGRIIPADYLLGNHDCHYFFDHGAFKCSGYDPRKRTIIQELINKDTRSKFKISTRVSPYLLSHAGYHPDLIHFADPEKENEAIQRALDGKFSEIYFGVGNCRGGRNLYGGPTWLDWNYEFEPVEGQPQIVGHTKGSRIGIDKADDGTVSYCLDTALHHVAIVDDETGEVTIVGLDG